MEYNGEPRQAAGNLLQDIKTELGLGPRLKLIGAVAGADGNGQAVHPRGPNKLLHLVGVGIGGVLRRDIHVVLNAGQTAQFPFHHHAVLVGVLHHLAGEGNVVGKGMLGPVDHHRGKAPVNAGLADGKVLAMVQVKGNGQARILYGGQFHQVAVLGVFPGPGGHLQNQRRAHFLGRLRNALDNFHIVDVKGADGIPALVGLLKHFCGRH